MVKNKSDKLIDKLKLENLSIENLIKVIDFKPESNYDWSLNDQLDAIDLLAYTASKEALLYLENIYKPLVVIKQGLEQDDKSEVPNNDVNLIQHYNYVNAKGPLAEALHYEIPLFENSKHHLKKLKPASELKYEQRTIYEKSVAHGTILKAMDRLQNSVALHLE